MRTQPISIFDSWISFPQILLKQSTTTSFIKLSGKTFYKHPDKLHGISMVSLLSSRFGVYHNGSYSFKPNYISSLSKTYYNGYGFQLRLSNDKVLLDITINGTVFPMSSWKLEELVKSLQIKNSNNRDIDINSVSKLILNGKMKVKFNVSSKKDHGTLWRVVS